MIDDIQRIAQNLLESGNIKVVIGYENAADGTTHPVFITKPENVKKLIFDENCHNNIAVFLSKAEVKEIGKPAIVASIPVLRTIRILIAENQLIDGNVTVIAVTPEGQVSALETFKDIIEFASKYPVELTAEESAIVEKIEKMTPEDRWKFWVKETSLCTKCYACRAACPLCYCNRCTVDCNQPQWINVPSHKLGNMEWHTMRAMHLAGRCSNCGACYSACPLNIPLNLLTQKIIKDIKNKFPDSSASTTEDEYTLSAFKPNDSEDFIR